VKLGDFPGVRNSLRAPRCWRKQRFTSQGAAWAQLRSLRKRGLTQEETRGPLLPYSCPHCAGWHTGHASNASGVS